MTIGQTAAGFLYNYRVIFRWQNARDGVQAALDTTNKNLYVSRQD